MDDNKPVKRRGAPPGKPHKPKSTPTNRATEESNAKKIKHAMHLISMEPVKMTDPFAVAKRIEDYFEACINDGMAPNLPGMALSLGCDRTTIWRYRTGKVGTPEVRAVIRKAWSVLDTLITLYAQNGEINPVMAIWMMKNSFGYTNNEVPLVEEDDKGQIVDMKELQDRYLASIPDIPEPPELPETSEAHKEEKPGK